MLRCLHGVAFLHSHWKSSLIFTFTFYVKESEATFKKRSVSHTICKHVVQDLVFTEKPLATYFFL